MFRAPRSLLCLLLMQTALSACRCSDSTLLGIAPRLTISPASLSFPDTLVGDESSMQVALDNTGRVTVELALTSEPPFFASTEKIELEPGQSRSLVVTFRPRAAGDFAGALHVQVELGIAVALQGRGVEPELCGASSAPCRRFVFEVSSRRCVEANAPDGTACTAPCLVDTACFRGACVGMPRACDDGVDCTLDVCSPESGCLHVPRAERCSGADRCSALRCDPIDGCVQESTQTCDDGIACTEDSCDADGGCEYVPNDSLCPQRPDCVATRCDPVDGCVVANATCDDGIACTDDLCDGAGGCVNSPNEARCPPPALCQVVSCSPTSGCHYSAALDGLACGSASCPDDRRCRAGVCGERDLLACGPLTSFEVLVSSHDSDAVIRYENHNGSVSWSFLDPLVGGVASWPHALIDVPGDDVFVANRKPHTLLRFQADAGYAVTQFGATSALDTPIGMARGADGHLYVSSYWRDSVLKYDARTRTYLGQFVAPGAGGLLGPYGLVFGPDGDLFVASERGNRVLRFDGRTGASKGIFTSGTTFTRPTALAFHGGYLWLATWSGVGFTGGAIIRFNASSGAYVDTFIAPGAGGLRSPHSFAFGPDGLLYVADYEGDAILRFDAVTGAPVDTWIPAFHASGLAGPSWMLFRPLSP